MTSTLYHHIKKKLFVKISLLFVVFFLILSIKAYSQRGAELGLTGGGSYYLGDINQVTHFYSVNPNIGVFARYHFNKRCTARLGVAFSALSADDADFNNKFQINRNKSFKTPLLELSLQFEINFLPFLIGDVKKQSFTPYIQSGLAAYSVSSENHSLGLAIPMGVGIKKNVLPRLVLGLEWSFRKTFSDYIDSVTGEDLKEYDKNYGVSFNENNFYKQLGFRYDKDWYSFFNFTISYTFKLGGLGCPAYYDKMK